MTVDGRPKRAAVAEFRLVAVPGVGPHGRMKVGDDVVSPATPTFSLVPVSPRLVWCVGLAGAPDCCHEHACQTR
jgi:hypothetical protein